MFFAVFRNNIKPGSLYQEIDRNIDIIYKDLIKEHGDDYKKYLLESSSKIVDDLKEKLQILERQVNSLDDIINQVDNDLMRKYYDIDEMKKLYNKKLSEGEELLIISLAYNKINGLTNSFKLLNDDGLLLV